MPKITINGREIQAKEGANVLGTALEHGIEIPHFCYHPALEVVGVCRLCLVAVNGSPKLQISCNTAVAEGMVIETNSPAVRKAREGMLEFLLLNHPLDCPICDKGGECPLQNFTHGYGPSGSRYRDPKLTRYKRRELGPTIVFDAERCILCWRCTRFSDEVTGKQELGLVKRGVHTEIDVLSGEPLSDPFSGNLADICPVGALTTSDFRFKSRPWDMGRTESACATCSLGCNIVLWHKRGEIQRITARPNPDVNDWWTCDRGRFGYHFTHAEARFRAPRVRRAPRVPGVPVAGAPEETTVEEARLRLFEGLSSTRAAGVTVLASPNLTNEEMYLLQKFARAVLGTDRIGVDGGPGGIAPRAALLPRTVASMADLEVAGAVLLAGEDVEQTHPVLFLRLRKAARLSRVPLHLLTPETTGLDRDAASFERVPLVDLPARIAASAAKLPAGAVVIVNARGRNAEVASLLAATTGAGAHGAGTQGAGAPGTDAPRVLFLDSGSNPAGSILLGLAPGWLPGPVRAGEASRAAFRALWGVSPAEPEPGARGRRATDPAPPDDGAPDDEGAALLARVRSGEGLVLVNGLVPREWSDPEAILRAAREAAFVAVWDFLPSVVAAEADLLLPARSYAETTGTTFAPDLRIQRLVEAVRAPESAPSLASTLAAVARRMGVLLETSEDVLFREMRRAVPALSALTPASVGRRGARPDLARLGELPSKSAAADGRSGVAVPGGLPAAMVAGPRAEEG